MPISPLVVTRDHRAGREGWVRSGNNTVSVLLIVLKLLDLRDEKGSRVVGEVDSRIEDLDISSVYCTAKRGAWAATAELG